MCNSLVIEIRHHLRSYEQNRSRPIPSDCTWYTSCSFFLSFYQVRLACIMYDGT
jgi:hypothetical protein